MIRHLMAALLGFSLSGCSLIGDDPEVASLPPVFGARVTDGRLELSTGTPCGEVSRVVVLFTPDAGRLTLAPVSGTAEVDQLTVGGPYDGLQVTEPLPDGFDWRTAEEVTLIVTAPEGSGSTPTQISEVVDGSSEHPADTFYFQGIGWLDPQQVAEQNRRSLLTICTTDPTKQ
ncbi:hypothetical protein ASE48_19085 [Mycobacterium sp. Root265]|uniref:hypothetical protein n=1 Tax=Mycobacterium sp. Root265 TaxID=1736504 RepID=UPI00070D2136|nr:hypothetical protein [Mycobacterium sp. Root265]KRD05288.1 hypothetical protein ASE48_19085 [Mycobacterium sp. Root265]